MRRATLSARRWAPRVRMCLPAALDRLRWASAAATGFRGGPEASSFKGASPPGACPAAGGRCCVPLGEGRAVDTYPPAAINDAGCGNGPRPFGLSPRARNASLLVSCWCLPAPSSRLALRARGGNGGASSRRICPFEARSLGPAPKPCGRSAGPTQPDQRGRQAHPNPWGPAPCGQRRPAQGDPEPLFERLA